MTLMADQDDLEPAIEVNVGLLVHLGHERARGVDVKKVTCLGSCRNRFRHAVCREDHRCPCFRYLVQIFHKNGTFGPERVYNESVVHDLMAHVDRWTIFCECKLDDLYGAVDARTESAGSGQQNGEFRLGRRLTVDAGDGHTVTAIKSSEET